MSFLNRVKAHVKDGLQNHTGHETPQIDNRQFALVFVLSGFLGFCLGFFGGTWQAIVEPSQIISGVVTYSGQSPFYIYQTTLWNILHQICALFLLSGVSERMLSLWISGIVGAVSLQALALCVLALSRNKILAILSPLLISFSGATDFGVCYPIWLMGTVHTYGMLGRSLILLILALMGLGQYKFAVLLLGIVLGIHPSWAAFLWLVIIICFIWDVQHLKSVFRKTFKYIVSGVAISVVSFGLHYLITYDAPPISSELTSKYVSAFIQLWDFHRRPVNFNSHGVYLAVASLIISLSWVLFFKRDLSQQALFLLRAFIVAGLLGLGFSLVTHLPQAIVPKSLLILMPGRFLNLNILGFMALLIGLLAYYRHRPGMQLLLAVFLSGVVLFQIIRIGLSRMIVPDSRISRMIQLIVPRFTNLSDSHAINWMISLHGQRMILWTAMLGVSIVLLGYRYLFFMRPKCFLAKQVFLNITKRIIILGLALNLSIMGVVNYFSWKQKEPLFDRTNDPLFAEVFSRQGMLLTASNITLSQLRTRRPILLEGGALDGLPYAPAAGPEMERVLRGVYQIDFFNPPPEVRNRGQIPPQYGKPLWESRTPEQWQEIKKHFGVTDIMTYPDWKLNLPEIASNEEFILYHIPEFD